MTTEVNNETMEQAQPVMPATAPAEANLTITDLAALRNLIDIVTTRGAFKANELSSVGALFDKLTVFLEAAQKQQEAQAATASAVPVGE
jgi:hypothetical protein